MNYRGAEKEKAKKEIVEYLQENQKAYPSDVADALQLNFDFVLELIKDLMKEGRVK